MADNWISPLSGANSMPANIPPPPAAASLDQPASRTEITIPPGPGQAQAAKAAEDQLWDLSSHNVKSEDAIKRVAAEGGLASTTQPNIPSASNAAPEWVSPLAKG